MKQSQNTTQAPVQIPLPKYGVKHSLVNIYLTLMFSFFPLFLTEQYAHARLDKYYFYLIATAIFIISTGLCMYFSYTQEIRADHKAALLTPLSVTDICMLCFLGFAVISTLMTEHPGEALLGPELFTNANTHSRNNGLLLLFMYMMMYFIITRNYVKKDYVFIIYLVTSSIIALLTVLNFFYIDPLHMLDGYDEATIADFGSLSPTADDATTLRLDGKRLLPTAAGESRTQLRITTTAADGNVLVSTADCPRMELGMYYTMNFDYASLAPYMRFEAMTINDWQEGWSITGEILNPTNN
jgi:hypothetical protein